MKVIDILQKEISSVMHLIGASKVEGLRPEMVSASYYFHGNIDECCQQVQRVDWEPSRLAKL